MENIIAKKHNPTTLCIPCLDFTPPENLFLPTPNTATPNSKINLYNQTILVLIDGREIPVGHAFRPREKAAALHITQG